MKYISTRGNAPALAFDDVLLSGLASDGGLYVPEEWPRFSAADIASFEGLPYPELALRVIRPFIGGTLDDGALAGIIDGAYANFDTPEIAPLKEIGKGEWLLELFHGPTLAFKDLAMQFLGPVFDHVLKARGEWVTIVGATSGDTGSAAIEACRDRAAIEIFILHPRGRISDVQRRQMTTVPSANVHNIAIDSHGLLYVADRENHRIQVFNQDGDFQTQFVNMSRTAAIYIDTRHEEDIVYIGEYFAGIGSNHMGTNLGPRVTVMNTKGEVLSRVGIESYGSQHGRFFTPHGISVDSHGDVYVAEVSHSDYGGGWNIDHELRSMQKLVRQR